MTALTAIIPALQVLQAGTATAVLLLACAVAAACLLTGQDWRPRT